MHQLPVRKSKKEGDRRTGPRGTLVAAIIAAVAFPSLVAAGEKALVLKLRIAKDGAGVTVPLPIADILAAGAALVEDYEEMAVVDLRSTTAEALARSIDLHVSPLPDHDKVMLRDFSLDADSALPARMTAPAFPAHVPNLYLVVLRSIPKPEWVESLSASGATIVSYVPNNTYLAYARRADLDALRTSAPYIINVLPFICEFKVLERNRLFGPDGFSRTLLQLVNQPAAEAVTEIVKSNATAGTYSTFALGDSIAIVGELPNHALEGLASHPETVLIEPAPQLEPSGEREALIVAGQVVSASEDGRTVYRPSSATDYYSWLSARGLANATDIHLGLLDTGLDLGSTSNVHTDFRNTSNGSRITYQFNPSGAPTASDCAGHGTLVAAVLGGSGGSSTGTQSSESATTTNRCAGCTGTCPNPTSCTAGVFWSGVGIAPAASIASAKIWDDQGGDDWPYIPNRVSQGIASLSGNGVWVANLSTNDAATSYTSLSQMLDQRVRDGSAIGLGWPISIVVSTGNEVGLVQAPATAKNIVAVGASESYNPFLDTTTCRAYADANNAYDVATFSGAGTLGEDGRWKPDIVAPGTRIMGALTRVTGVCWGYKTCGRSALPGMDGVHDISWSWGTSFAAPAVGGAAGLVSKWFKNQYAVVPSPAMTKAMLLNAALDIAGGMRGAVTIDHIPSQYRRVGEG